MSSLSSFLLANAVLSSCFVCTCRHEPAVTQRLRVIDPQRCYQGFHRHWYRFDGHRRGSGLKFTVPGGPKLVKFDPKTGQMLLTSPFPADVAPRKSCLNDVRIGLQNNYVYLTFFEQSALLRRTPTGKIETIAKDARLQWPDTYSFAAVGNLYVANSAIHKTPNWNKGVGPSRQPFGIFKMPMPK